MKIIWSLVGFVALVVLIFWGAHTWYVDTHCTTVLGTQVCQPNGSNGGSPAGGSSQITPDPQPSPLLLGPSPGPQNAGNAYAVYSQQCAAEYGPDYAFLLSGKCVAVPHQ